jgi:hypothetical protein
MRVQPASHGLPLQGRERRAVAATMLFACCPIFQMINAGPRRLVRGCLAKQARRRRGTIHRPMPDIHKPEGR